MTTREAWRLLPFTRLPADEQMAWAAAMLSAVTAPALRWRQTVPEALILGRGQPETSINFDACRAAGCAVYRRATGGTAVLSGPELLGADIVLPPGHPLALADVTQSYRWLGEALAAGLRGLGVPALAVEPEAARAAREALPAGDPLRLACYALPSPYEVVAGGRKLAGLAQARRRSGVLLQAGVLLRWQPERLVPLLAIPVAQQEQTIAALRGRAVGLDELSGSVDRSALVARLTEAIACAAGAAFEQAAWSDAEEAAFREALSQVVALE